MIRLAHICIAAAFLPQQEYPLKDGRPTTKGIEMYVEEMTGPLIREYQEYIGDTLYSVWIYAEDLTDFGMGDPLELGHYYNDEIYISTSEQFYAYELADLSDFRKSLYEDNNKFVKAAIFHELTHDYINQLTWEMLSVDSIRVDRSYQTYIWILRSFESFGATFIEEGICEYLVEKKGEVITPENRFVPRTVDELTDPENRYRVVYKYAATFVGDFLDENGFKRGIKILLHNPPPTYEEILNPELFFSRLLYP